MLLNSWQKCPFVMICCVIVPTNKTSRCWPLDEPGWHKRSKAMTLVCILHDRLFMIPWPWIPSAIRSFWDRDNITDSISSSGTLKPCRDNHNVTDESFECILWKDGVHILLKIWLCLFPEVQLTITATDVFIVVNFDALAQASDFPIEKR